MWIPGCNAVLVRQPCSLLVWSLLDATDRVRRERRKAEVSLAGADKRHVWCVHSRRVSLVREFLSFYLESQSKVSKQIQYFHHQGMPTRRMQTTV